MKKQIIGATILVAGLAAYTLVTSEKLTTDRETFVANCTANSGIYAEGVLTKKKWEAADANAPTGKGLYRMQFTKHELEAPTTATLPGIKKALDASRRTPARGKSYALCLKHDLELIDYYKSF